MTRSKSSALWQQAQKLIPGGVNSPVRAFGAVGGNPIFIKSGSGSKIYDVDGNEYVDYVGSWGPLILGHAHPRVLKAIENALHKGTSFGAPTQLEVELAGLIVKAFPPVELVRMVNSGTEATMSAIRLARGYTKRDKVIKAEGCYHGHVDSLLIRAGSGASTFGVPDSPGVPDDFVKHTLIVPFNDAKSVKKAIEKHPDQIACMIIEPVAGNMGVVLPKDGYLEEIRELTKQNGILLIFDEIITGFRINYGGVQQLYKIKPDLTCLGKIIGGGMPVGAYGGKKEIMQNVSPLGLKVYQAGTLSGNPLAISAGIETLKLLSDPKVYETLENRSKALEEGLKSATKAANVDAYHTRLGSMLCTFFTKMEVVDYQSANSSDRAKYARYFNALLEKGIYIAPSQLEATFVSLAHSEEDIEKTIKAAREALKKI